MLDPYKAPEDLLEKARACFKLADEAENRQRIQEREDLRFQVPEEQWDDASRAARRGDAITPARPMLSITQLDAPIRLTRNQARAAKLGVNVHPVTEGADEDTAEVIQGLYRRIERDSNATTARMWALDRALKTGRGFYRIITAYDEDAGDTFDQEIRIERILYQDSVYLDPTAKEPDWSDGKWAFVVGWLTRRDFKELYPDARISAASSTAEWEAIWSVTPEWARGGFGDDSAVRIAEYWYKETTRTKVKVGDQEREREDVAVYVCTFTGPEILEKPKRWNGRYIPIVPVLGNELQPFDERRRFAGMITNAKDAQRFFNYAASSLVEGMALEPKAPFIGAEGQFEDHEDQWRQANIRNFPFLEYKPIDLNGKPAPPPQRAQVDGTRMSLATMGLQAASGWVQQTTAVHEPSLGKEDREHRSGRALLALQSQADMSNGDYITGLEVAMAYEARVVLDLMPAVYDRPGRVTRILRGDDQKTEAVMLNAPFVAKDGRPQRVQKGVQGAKQFDLRAGRYGINVEIGRSFRTRLQEGDESLSRLIEARPDLLEVIGDIWFNFKDLPAAREISKRFAKLREAKHPGLGEGEDGQPSPEAAAAKAQAMQQENAQLKQQLQGAAQAIQTDQAKQQAQIAKAQIDQRGAVAKAQMDHQASLEKTRMETESREIIAAAQEETKRLIAGLQLQIDAQAALLEAAGVHMEHREGMAHEVAMAAAQPTPEPEPPGESKETLGV